MSPDPFDSLTPLIPPLRNDYLGRCRVLLKLTEPEPLDPDVTQTTGDADSAESEPTKTCPHCNIPLACTGSPRHPSWRDLFADHAICPLWYQPLERPPFDVPRIHSPETWAR